MKEIISKVPVDVIMSELTPDKKMRDTNKGGNEIYILTAHDSPNIMREIGRLREITFREAGGGTGFEVDIDDYDTQAVPYKQLIVWNPDEREILGGYRYLLCDQISYNSNGEPILPHRTCSILPKSFYRISCPTPLNWDVRLFNPTYQSSKAGAKALFALDNLWDGLGALTVDHPKMKYFFGKVTMYTHFNVKARDLILCFLRTYFDDHEQLIETKEKYKLEFDFSDIEHVFKVPISRKTTKLNPLGTRQW
jgi:hypothetical protein